MYELVTTRHNLMAKSIELHLDLQSRAIVFQHAIAAQLQQCAANHRNFLWDRCQLKTLSTGKVSSIFGKQFSFQDNFIRQVRMPAPPFLLADRIIKINAEPLVLGKGEIITETDVRANSWYLDNDTIPYAIAIEAGQADLLLSSWMGVDQYNQDKAVYRLLNFTMRYYGGLAKIGDTLQFHIRILDHIQHGSYRFFGFEYDAYIDNELRMSMRNGQAGFFTEEALARSSGLMLTEKQMQADLNLPFELPKKHTHKTYFDRNALQACFEKNFTHCFGDHFRLLHAQRQPPNIMGGRFLVFEEISELNFTGGPWSRGYLKAKQLIKPNDWFFEGHFHNDPTMPGTFMVQLSVQLIRFYMIAAGLTHGHDGWRFEPLDGFESPMLCRAPVMPSSKEVIYELFIEGIQCKPTPIIYTQVLMTVDGVKSVHCKIPMQLKPCFMADRNSPLLRQIKNSKPPVKNHFVFDDYSLLIACVNGKPQTMFGDIYKDVPDYYQAPHLPNFPYHFVSRILDIDVEPGIGKAGGHVVAEFDIPIDSWFFLDNGNHTMPFGVLLESALQPAGWLSSYCGFGYRKGEALKFRNLGGKGRLHHEIRPKKNNVMHVKAKFTDVSPLNDMVLMNFDIQCYQDDICYYELSSTFGSFPEKAFEKQAGIAATEEEQHFFDADQNMTQIIHDWPEKKFIAKKPLLMIDEVTGFWDNKTQAAIRCVKHIDINEWFFKVHFYQDPVQPGSLGLQGCMQTLQAYALLKGYHKKFHHPRFRSILLNEEHQWQYRGQVTPNNELITIIAIIDKEEIQHDKVAVTANFSFWLDGQKVYQAHFGTELVEEKFSEYRVLDFVDEHNHVSDTFSLAKYPLFADCCYNHADALIPLSFMLDRMSIAALTQKPLAQVTQVEDLHLRGLVVPSATKINSTVKALGRDQFTVALLQAQQRIAVGNITLADHYPESPNIELPKQSDYPHYIEQPYAELFYGKGLQLLDRLYYAKRASFAMINSYQPWLPISTVHPFLLEALLQLIPLNNMNLWLDTIAEKIIAFPHTIKTLQFYSEPPTLQQTLATARLIDSNWDKLLQKGYVTVEINAFSQQQLWVSLRVILRLYAIPQTMQCTTLERKQFCCDNVFNEKLSVATVTWPNAELTFKALLAAQPVLGDLKKIYNVAGDLKQQTKLIATKDLFAQHYRIHPSLVTVLSENQVMIPVGNGVTQSYGYTMTSQGITVNAKSI